MPVRGETILTIPAATSDKKIVFCKQHIPRTCAKVHVSPVSSLLPSFLVPINVSTVVIRDSGFGIIYFSHASTKDDNSVVA